MGTPFFSCLHAIESVPFFVQNRIEGHPLKLEGPEQSGDRQVPSFCGRPERRFCERGAQPKFLRDRFFQVHVSLGDGQLGYEFPRAPLMQSDVHPCAPFLRGIYFSCSFVALAMGRGAYVRRGASRSESRE